MNLKTESLFKLDQPASSLL